MKDERMMTGAVSNNVSRLVPPATDYVVWPDRFSVVRLRDFSGTAPLAQ
jgi:hypothetical protein